MVSKFALGCGRTGTDRQFFYVNGRPCSLGKVRESTCLSFCLFVILSLGHSSRAPLISCICPVYNFFFIHSFFYFIFLSHPVLTHPFTPNIQVQKAFNEVYRSFNATQSPFVVADFIIPTGKSVYPRLHSKPSFLRTLLSMHSVTPLVPESDRFTESCDINVSPDKRTIFLHSEGNLIAGLKVLCSSTCS